MRYEWGSDQQLLRDGETVGTTDRSRWRERATVTTDVGTWSFRAQGSRRVLVTGSTGIERVAATCTGWFTTVWTVSGEGGAYEVRPAHPLTSRLVVRRGEQQVATLTAARWWTDRPALEVSDDLPLGDVVLLLWVGYVIKQRATGASGGTVASTGAIG